MMQFGIINEPVVGFVAERQLLLFFLGSQYWELPYNWDFGRDREAIDPVDNITSGIEKYLPFTVDSVEVTATKIIITLKGKILYVPI